MRPPLSSNGRPTLDNLTNVPFDDTLEPPLDLPSGTGYKRPASPIDTRDPKRVKTDANTCIHDKDTSSDSDSDVDVDSVTVLNARARKRTVFAMRDAAMMAPSSSLMRFALLPTHPILRTFVSSNKSDVFKCHSEDASSYLTVPYACAYSRAAKRGGTPLLAVATEQGLVHILNTARRADWDFEIQRTTLQPHTNGVFDIQWSPSDTLLATASGDHSTRITTLDSSVVSDHRTLHVLCGHTGTVKCVVWDPARDDVLCTGGRDGGICVWDLRAGETRDDDSEPGALTPVLKLPGAHEALGKPPPKPRARKGKLAPVAPLRSITGLVFVPGDSHTLVSSGSFDGILRQWDLRQPPALRPTRPFAPPADMSPRDPTTAQGSRARGLTSLVAGGGGLLFALGTDARVHTYDARALAPLGVRMQPQAEPRAETQKQTQSFYVRLAAAPCGRWLARGGADGRVLLFDVGATGGRGIGRGVELRGQTGEVGAVDWADDMLAACADDGTVRVWRPDGDLHQRCVDNIAEMQWEWSWAISE